MTYNISEERNLIYSVAEAWIHATM